MAQQKKQTAARKPASDTLSDGVDPFDDRESGEGKKPADNIDAKPPPRAARSPSAPAKQYVAPPSRKPRTDPSAGSAAVVSSAASPPRPTVTLDQRKLTKKQDADLSQWHGERRGRTLDDYFKAQLDVARTKFGHGSVMAGSDTYNLVIGIPCLGGLAFEYLIAQDCFPLGLMFHLVGDYGSCKSAMLYEIFRWFRAAGGGSFLEEVETKFSPDLMQSIVRFGDDEVNVILDRCNSVEEWQQRLQYHIDDNKKRLAGTQKEPGPGRTIPMCFGVDSIMGKASFETQEKVHDTGFAGRAFPLEALSITTFMKTVPQMIDGWPFAIVLNNHMKMGRDSAGHDERRTAGGKGVGFQESFELEMSVQKRKISCAAWDGVQLGIQCFKNSFGPSFRRITTRMLWWEVEDPDHPEHADPKHWRQVTVWDWDWATIKLLADLTGPKGGREKAKLQEAGVHVATPTVSDVENTAWSKSLGMKEADAVSWSELGKRIVADDKLMRTIRGCLGIKQRPLLAGDYLKQLNKLAATLP